MKTPRWLVQIRAFNPWVLGSGLVLMLAGILLAFIYDKTVWWNLFPLILGILALLAFLAANLAEVRETGRKRSTQVRAGLVMVGLAMLGILAGLNYITARHPVRFDLTSNKFYSLSEQTLDVLKKLKDDVHVTLYITQRRNTLPEVGRARMLLQEYAKKCTKFKFNVVDVDKNPSEARRANIRELNAVVFESGPNRKDVLQRDYVTYTFQGRQPIPKFQGEGAFTSALVTMMEKSQRLFYFTEGHGEKEMDNPQQDGLSSLKDLIAKANYAVTVLNLAKTGKVPDDAAAVVSAGPKRSFSPQEVQVLQEWLKAGGKYMLCVDPRVPVGSFGPILKDFGVEFGDNIVLDKTSYAFPDLLAVIPQYRYLPIVEKLSDSKTFSILPFSRSVTTCEPRLPKAQPMILLETTAEGWGETNYTDKKPVYNAGADLKGPVPMAVSSEWSSPEKPETKCRLLVFGGSTWLTNVMSQAPGNFDLAMNALNWLALEENKMSIRPKEEEQRMMSLSNVGINFVRILSMFILPFGILAFGAFVWYKRRAL